jgi:hypothetical protein
MSSRSSSSDDGIGRRHRRADRPGAADVGDSPRLGSATAGPLGPGGQPLGSHEQHGTPKGWKLTWPKGDPAKGRAVFAKLECYSCHEVRGEKFPAPKEKEKVGPELSMMVDREGRVHCSVRRLRQPGRWRHVQLRCARTRPPGKSRNRWGTGAAPRLVVVAAGGL